MQTRTKRHRGSLKNANRGSDNANQGPTRGVRILRERVGRPQPYGVQWSERGWDEQTKKEKRRVRTLFFASAADRDRKAQSVRDAKREGSLRTLSRREVDDWAAFQTAIGGTPWHEVVAGWRSHQLAIGVTPSKTTVAEHAKDFLQRIAQRVAAGTFSAGTECHHKHKLRLFCEVFGHLRPVEVTAEQIAAWLDDQQLAVAATYNNYRKTIGVFFSDCRDARLIGENPIARIKQRAEVREEVGILTVAQLAQLFHTAHTFADSDGRRKFAAALWRLSLEAFAGVRFGSACRLRREDVSPADQGIRHPAASIKTRKRHYVDGYPAHLWAWLAVAPAESLTARQYLELKSELFGVARVPHPHNCLRHSFATYHVAARGDPGKTAYLLIHKDQKKLWNHYKGNATGAEGRLWEELTPQRAEEMGQPWRDELARRAKDPHPTSAPAPAGHRSRRVARGGG